MDDKELKDRVDVGALDGLMEDLQEKSAECRDSGTVAATVVPRKIAFYIEMATDDRKLWDFAYEEFFDNTVATPKELKVLVESTVATVAPVLPDAVFTLIEDGLRFEIHKVPMEFIVGGILGELSTLGSDVVDVADFAEKVQKVLPDVNGVVLPDDAPNEEE